MAGPIPIEKPLEDALNEIRDEVDDYVRRVIDGVLAGEEPEPVWQRIVEESLRET